MQQVFEGGSIADPGTPSRRRLCWIAAAVLVAVITGMQQFNVFQHATKAKPVPTVEPAEPDASKKAALAPLGPDLDQVDIGGRIMVKMFHGFDSANKSQLKDEFESNVNPSDQPDPANGVRLVPASAEVAGREKALAEIGKLREAISRNSGKSDAERAELSKDLDALESLYTRGADSLSADGRERIEERLGWQGRLALTFGKPDSDPERAALIANGIPLLVFLVLIFIGAAVALVTGLVLLIVACVRLANGKLRPRLDKPMLGGSIGIEVVVVFLACFAGLKLLMEFAGLAAKNGWLGESLKQDPSLLSVAALILQWVILPLVVFYPRMRGYPRWHVKRALGWHRGRGFAKEILAGVAGYLACMPLYVVAVLVALVLMIIEQAIVKSASGEEPTGPVNPIGGMLAQSWWIAILVAALATIWAPIVEETVFRGSLFRQLYARIGVVGSAVISGTVFAMMHGYSPSLFPPLIMLGTWFALIRWWRGSLVGCVAAHALHNGTLMVVMFVLFSLLK